MATADDYTRLAQKIAASKKADERDGLLDLWLELRRLDGALEGAWPWQDVRSDAGP